MIDLNKYYISSVYQGASGGSEGRSGFVPKALSGDEFKFLRGDGTWQNSYQTLSYTPSSIEVSISNGNTVALDNLITKTQALAYSIAL